MTLPAQEVIEWTTPRLMTTALFLHIGGGSLAILAGYAAVLSRKGAPVHRVAGAGFMVGMTALGLTAAYMGLNRDQPGNVFAALFVLYMILTAWTAAKRPDGGRPGLFDLLALVAAIVMAALAFLKGIEPGVSSSGLPNFISLPFAAVLALGAGYDLKVLLKRGVSGVQRISRHLWRMCAAFFVASGSFFLGQMDTIPDAFHGPHLWALALFPLFAIPFWLIRVRLKRRAAPAPAAA